MMVNQPIIVRGAREHNLQNVNLELPRNSLIVFTGVSGSGKSSLAFDTLYAEGQRRYVESLSSYARQFLGQLPKPDCDFIGGLSPTISIQQKSAVRNPRSTVGTITEIADYLRVLYARIGQGHCPKCGKPITAQSREQIIDRVLALPPETRFLILAPVVRGQKGEFKDFFADMLRRGFVRARVDGQIVRLSDNLGLDRRIKHDIAIIIDRLKNEPRIRSRLAEAVEQSLALANGALIISVEEEKPKNAKAKDEDESETKTTDILLSAHYACTTCNVSYEPPSPQLFSFNSPHGMCLECDGLGTSYTFDPTLLVPDPNLSFFDGAFPLIGKLKGMGRWRKHIYEGLAKNLDIDLKVPWKDLPPEHQNLLLLGSGEKHIVYEWKQRGGGVWRHGGRWEGIIPQLLSSFKKAASGPRRMQLEKYMRIVRCPSCSGERLNAQARAVRVGDKTLIQVGNMPINVLAEWFDGVEGQFDRVQKIIAGELLREIRSRLVFLLNVGLHYLSLDRSAPTLSGGEAQRIRLAGQIGSGLVGVLYILDEPSIGLHPRDNERLLRSLEQLRDMGNTVIVVEHDDETMRSADYLVDFGPGPGVRGGEIVAAGTPAEVLANPASVTGRFLTGLESIEIPKKRRERTKRQIQIVGARHNNLKNINVDVPLGLFVCITGVSGSGKSSLINDILLAGLRSPEKPETDSEEENDEFGGTEAVIGSRCDKIVGAEQIDKIIDIDQSPIGRTPRSNPATYIKVFDEIRSLFADMSEAKVRGYQSGRFSFNRPGGRCEACEGNGSTKLEMDFLADVWVKCPVCEGRRFNRETLQVRYRGKNIHDVLEMDVQEALSHFENIPKIRVMLQTLHDVGMDYIKLGQASTTLSGGEAQRIKLAKELCRRGTGKTLYVLDEPTTGLHFEDIRRLLKVLHGFVEAGNTVLVIEHNLDVMKTADYLIDLGPDGGVGGGQLVAFGTPEEIAACKTSLTGQALKLVLSPRKPEAAKKKKANKPSRVAQERITHLTVQGAQQHNLKNITVKMPREQMTVCCGPSGSGKSTLAIDTIYAEGQRRYVESLSSYARQFLGQVQKPKVDHISGLSPSICIEQKTSSKSPRSTVGTITEVYDYLRVLFARLGQHWCPTCNIPIGTQTADEIIERILALPEGTKLYIMAPLERKGQEKYEAIFDEIRRTGYSRMRVDGKSYNLDEPPTIDHRRKHSIEVVIDRNIVKPNTRTRIAEAVETALDLGRGIIHLAYVDQEVDERKWKVDRFSQHLACDKCGKSFEPLNPHHFSFNSSLGWCPACEGLGVQKGANQALLIGDDTKSIRAGAVAAWPSLEETSSFLPFVEALAHEAGFSLDVPYRELDAIHQRVILHGSGEDWISLETSLGVRFQYKGLLPAIDEASRVSHTYRQTLDHLVDEVPCSVCHGSRLRSDAAAVHFTSKTLSQLCQQPIGKTLEFFDELSLANEQKRVAGELLREISNRLQFLVDVGLDYLSLSRSGPTLSGGESQRIRLASQIGSGLTGVLYVLDEPTIGLHPRDNTRLLKALIKLRDLGNTLVLVEHDKEVIAHADYLLDFGPGAGKNGGEITAEGTPKQVSKSKRSLTGQYLSGSKAIAVPTNRRTSNLDVPIDQVNREMVAARSPKEQVLSVIGAREHNLRNIDVHFPLGTFIAVTGVSGSGKSSLINEVLFNTLSRRLHRSKTAGAAHDDILGIEAIDKIINVDQEPIGSSPSSNPATFTGVFDLIRQLFAQLPDSKVRGYHPRRFSFNQPGGRCDACEGNGQKKIEMHFLPDVWVECETCQGKRYNPETLAIHYHGKSIADVLEMRVSEALELFGNIPKIRVVLQTLSDVGLDYLALGQAAPTLSGGEAQRVKLAAELARPSTGKTLYLLDEPTTGLHFDDIRKLLEVLHRLVDRGNTVITVEHNLDVIKTADWIIDLGPEAGNDGGAIVALGTPEDIVRQAAEEGSPSHTASFIAEALEAGPYVKREKYNPDEALAPRENDIALEAVGKDAKLPWQVDGRRWHTTDRITTTGKPSRWDGELLNWIDTEIHRLGDFSETDWSERTVIEIAGPKKSLGWFFHGHTGMEWLTRFVFRVKKNTFKQELLEQELALKPLHEFTELQFYNRESRINVANRKAPWQEVWMLLYKKEEIETPAFQTFLKKAVQSFQQSLGALSSSPEDVMPWKRNGEAWHLGLKGFPPGKRVVWDRSILPAFLSVIKEVDPQIEIRWDSRDAILLKLPNIGKAWAKIRTKDADVLDCRFLGKPGQFNLSRLEGIGLNPTLKADRADGGETLMIQLRNQEDMPRTKLLALLREHREGFIQRFQGTVE
ncbi:MAG: excinuclease ABC subunit UvrA [Planctomycetes bacterium]|nr:excinuclease ABC subunit UvrA [Planctomycetota bacterium]